MQGAGAGHRVPRLNWTAWPVQARSSGVGIAQYITRGGEHGFGWVDQAPMGDATPVLRRHLCTGAHAQVAPCLNHGNRPD